MEKNRLFTFLFAFMPGAGQMYLGMMKKGIILMSSFLVFFAIASYFGFYFTICILPVIWFYAFFDTMNMRHLGYETRIQMDEDFFESTIRFLDNLSDGNAYNLLNKRHVVLGVICVIIGSYTLIERVLFRVINSAFDLPYWINSLFYSIPTIVVAFFIIGFGLYLVKGDKKETKREDEFIEYKGDNHE